MLLTAVLVFHSVFFVTTAASPKYQRVFVTTRAINFIDTTKYGFRVILLDSFLNTYLAPNYIPTMFVTAYPLSGKESPVTAVFYPDTVREDKQVNLSHLRECSWYYICVEWENFNRHNESTGTDCQLLRTLDRFGKLADTTVTTIDIVDIGATTMQFKIRSVVDFSLRLTVSLRGGKGPLAASQVFSFHESSDLEVIFSFLKQDTDYGQLCIMEEPMVSGYTVMGRLIAQKALEKCYFDNLVTKDYLLSAFVESDASPYKRSASRASTSKSRVPIILYTLINSLLYATYG